MSKLFLNDGCVCFSFFVFKEYLCGDNYLFEINYIIKYSSTLSLVVLPLQLLSMVGGSFISGSVLRRYRERSDNVMIS